MKIKRYLLLLIINLLLIFPVFGLDFKSDKVILINLNDSQVLYEKNSNEKAMIASLTKIVTAITAIDNIDNLDEKVVIDYSMLSGLDGYTKAGLKVGDKISYEELLYALMLPSGADAANAIALSLSNSIDNFADLMNSEVAKIGAENSHFTNPVGMDDDENYSTASDLAKIVKYALNNETFKKIFEANSYYMKSVDLTVKKTYNETAKAYGIDSSIISGGKTGYTLYAGRCLASIANLDETSLLLININAPGSTLDYITDAVNTYTYYDENYSYKRFKSSGDTLYTIPIKNAFQKEYSVVLKNDIDLYVENNLNMEDIKINYDGVEYLEKNIKQGDKLGTIELVNENNVLYSYDIYLEENIYYHNYLLYGGILLLLIIIIFSRKKRKRRHA